MTANLPSREARAQAMRRTSIVGASVNLVLTIGQIVVGVLAHSAALVADGVHTLSDLATDVMVWFAAGVSTQPPDREHPYGHGRIETVFTVALGTVLMLTALGILVSAGQRLLNPSQLQAPGALALVVAAVTILAKEGLYRYTVRAAVFFQSNLLRANAWHHRSDAISSVVVFVGVAGGLLGFKFMDSFAAVGVALMIAHIAWGLIRKATRELVDTGLEPERLRAIRALINEVEGVRDLLLLRTRRSAGQVLLDAHVRVSPELSVSEGHQIGMYVRDRLLASQLGIIDVTIHVDLESEEQEERPRGLPLRREVTANLRECWSQHLPNAAFAQLVLHYFDGHVGVDVRLPWSADPDIDPPALAARLKQVAQQLPWLGEVRVQWV
jgi:cation diffusion facilitator family transporter